MKGFYRKLLPLLLVVVVICLALNYSLGGGSGVTGPPQAQRDTGNTQPKEVVTITQGSNLQKESISTVAAVKTIRRPAEKKKIAYAITITKDGERSSR